jgi:hypothetical protein
MEPRKSFGLTRPHTNACATRLDAAHMGDRTARAPSGKRDYMLALALASAHRVENAITGFSFSSSTTQPATSNETGVEMGHRLPPSGAADPDEIWTHNDAEVGGIGRRLAPEAANYRSAGVAAGRSPTPPSRSRSSVRWRPRCECRRIAREGDRRRGRGGKAWLAGHDKRTTPL